MEMTIGQFAKFVDSTVRTLRYYDKMKLLTPKKLNKNGRKIYTQLEWEHFQQILILKHLGLTLNEIKEQMTKQKFNNRELLQVQKRLIEEKQAELNGKLEVITRMERLYNIEGISEEELNEFNFIMLDLFRKEKSQIQILEKHFRDDKEILKEIQVLYDPDYKERMDRAIWFLLQAIRNVIHYNDSASRKKVQEILNEMNNLFPASRNILNLVDDDHFLAKYYHEFTNYFPENIASYMYKELKTYYDENDNNE
ncbi:MerR family transcriptional regulator [Halalkalibacter krulwichiae]|uniref:HTH-type transcriptional activator mta n=1 Tax=Halalkalibacter krulwichiae TaxID=199441 RepID=A0A1X9M9A6_9BACI|nr:MerR family transcriptional regulator [Halalkalibacter krulwichiae]ARK30039.1 HTH-type transcriptional activator mta [Halalkalibacter krulwichiae]